MKQTSEEGWSHQPLIREVGFNSEQVHFQLPDHRPCRSILHHTSLITLGIGLNHSFFWRSFKRHERRYSSTNRRFRRRCHYWVFACRLVRSSCIFGHCFFFASRVLVYITSISLITPSTPSAYLFLSLPPATLAPDLLRLYVFSLFLPLVATSPSVLAKNCT